ncbi:unnamed protein product [Blepharisma stoltei]|uniref:Uncharacterized protein n=1 Tax=Blepharisma stoltei TaxID=1481888 RepID=A0AAU9JNQ1_9CILI|nr:unnamed protein product [Blepharisma stoltei]
MENSQSSTADICSKLEGKLDLQDISKSLVGIQDSTPFELSLVSPNATDMMDLGSLDVNNFGVHQSPQPYLTEEGSNWLINGEPISDSILVFQAEDQHSQEANHLLDQDVYEDSMSSFYNSSSYSSSSNSNTQSVISNAREGSIIETKPKKNLTRYHPHTLFLAKFYSKGKMIPPKKEYIRIAPIRSHKKLFRYIEVNKPLCKVIKDLNVRSPTVLKIVKRLKILFEQHKDDFKKISRTESGPKTDGSKKNKRPEHKSWNNSYIKEYFENPAVLESYLLHVELIFADCDINTLIKRLNVECCKNAEHSQECDIKWEAMKKFISEEIITDLGVSIPFDTNKQNILTGVETIPARSQGFGSGNIESFLASNQEIRNLI